jgi:capsular polysaccharide biosynthesis protein
MEVTELRDHLRARPALRPGAGRALPPLHGWLRTGLWMVPLVLALSVGTAVVATSRQTPTYRTSATLAVVPNATIRDGPELLRSIETLDRRTVIATFAQIPSTERIRVTAARAVALQADSLGYYLSQAFVIPNTNLIRIEVAGPDPARAAAFANALATTTTSEAKAMYRVFDMTPLAAAVRPTAPVAPNPRRAIALAAILGAFLGIAATYLLVRPPSSPSALA